MSSLATGLPLPPMLARRKELCTTEEIAASLRHRILGDLAGLGATLMTLRRRLTERYPGATVDPEIQARIDPEELQVAVACLLENAVDAVQAKGRGVVAVSSPDGGENQAILEIADDGEGVSAEAGAKLFDAFFSTRPGRLGLGLNVARRLARRWGGEVTVAPRPPHGTRVRLVLPYGS
jgi:signal transduction histidine kinase